MDAMPKVVGLCPVHQREFYMPDPDEHGVCPECPERLALYLPVDHMRESRIARARGLAQAISECRDDALLDGVREGAAEILELLQ